MYATQNTLENTVSKIGNTGVDTTTEHARDWKLCTEHDIKHPFKGAGSTEGNEKERICEEDKKNLFLLNVVQFGRK